MTKYHIVIREIKEYDLGIIEAPDEQTARNMIDNECDLEWGDYVEVSAREIKT